MSYYFWKIMWMKNVNNFQIAKVQPQGVTLLLTYLAKEDSNRPKYTTNL